MASVASVVAHTLRGKGGGAAWGVSKQDGADVLHSGPAHCICTSVGIRGLCGCSTPTSHPWRGGAAYLLTPTLFLLEESTTSIAAPACIITHRKVF